MIKIFWYLILIGFFAIIFSLLLDNNGTIVINWLDYQISTDILTASIIIIIAFIFFAVLLQIAIRILAIKFPFLLKTFFTKTYTKKLEKSLRRQLLGFDSLVDFLLAMQNKNYQLAKSAYQNFSFHIKNKQLNSVLQAKLAFDLNNFNNASKLFENIDSQQANILAKYSKLQLAIQQNQLSTALNNANEILQTNPNHIGTISSLIDIYKQNNMWQELQSLFSEKKHLIKQNNLLLNYDYAILACEIAKQKLQTKQNFSAINFAKNSLKSLPNFLPAQLIIVKSYAKLKLTKLANIYLYNFLCNNPNFALIKLWYALNKKMSYAKQLTAVKKFSKKSGIFIDLAIAYIAFKNSDFEVSCRYLMQCLKSEKNHQIYSLLAYNHKNLGNLQMFQQYFALAQQQKTTLCN
jgi:uncharacterized membrane-anchored protein